MHFSSAERKELVSLESCSVAQLCLTLDDPMDCSSTLGFLFSWSLLKLLPIELMMPSNHLILCHPLLLPSVFPFTRVFSSESAPRIRLSKYWDFSFTIGPSSEYSGLISFRIDWLDLLAVQGTLRVFFSTTVQRHQLFSAQSSPCSNSHTHT